MPNIQPHHFVGDGLRCAECGVSCWDIASGAHFLMNVIPTSDTERDREIARGLELLLHWHRDEIIKGVREKLRDVLGGVSG